MVYFARIYLHGAGPDDPRASPVFADVRALPPLLFQVGSTELLLDDARAVHEKALRAGVASRLYVYDRACHGWQMGNDLIPEAGEALREAAAFIRAHCRRVSEPTG